MKRPVVAVLTDFGTSDGYVGAMKGVILSIARDVQIVDISHEIAPQDVRSGARALREATPFYPDGTIFVAVVDPGVGTARKPILLRSRRRLRAPLTYLFVGPDNGLLSLAVEADTEGWILDNSTLHRDEVSTTFHGRDIFASVAGHLAAGIEPERCGSRLDDWIELRRPQVRTEGRMIVGRVIHVDRFGNLITNVPTARICAGQWDVELADRPIGKIRNTFGDVEPGGWVAYLGSGGELEIAIRNGRAADVVELHEAKVKVYPCTD